jgi:transposase InsO family protein
MCRETGVSRAGFYRYWQRCGPTAEEIELRERLQELALGQRTYGYRRIAALLRREGRLVNHKRVLRLLRADNLLALRKKRFLSTTDGRHTWRVWPNLARFIRPQAPNRQWVADITYLRLRGEFCYLAVVLDVWSRRVVGWALSNDLTANLTLDALRAALAERRPQPGWIHHSDRGTQYACGEYVALLEQHGAQISMSRPGNPYDNAFCESFIGKLKQEQWDGRRYQNLAEVRADLKRMLDEVYNRQRLHSALGYLSPAEFETINANPAQPTPDNLSLISLSH